MATLSTGHGQANGIAVPETTAAGTEDVKNAAILTETETISENTPKAPFYPKPAIRLVDHYIDEPRPLRLGIIGGGLAGVLAGILLPAKVPNLELVIYEKNKDFVCFTLFHFPSFYFFFCFST